MGLGAAIAGALVAYELFGTGSKKAEAPPKPAPPTQRDRFQAALNALPPQPVTRTPHRRKEKTGLCDYLAAGLVLWMFGSLALITLSALYQIIIMCL